MKYFQTMALVSMLFALQGCEKEDSHNLSTVVLAGYGGRTWMVVGYSEYYHFNGRSNDSIVHYPRDTSVHLYFAIDWSMEINKPQFERALSLAKPCRWGYNNHRQVISFTTATLKQEWSVDWYTQHADTSHLPLLVIFGELPKDSSGVTNLESKSGQLSLVLAGEGKF